MNSLREALVHLLLDCGRICGVDPTRDIVYVTRRSEEEGDSFLTITLPVYGQAFERSLDCGRLVLTEFASFRKRRRAGSTGRPAFLSDFLDLIFGNDGNLLDGAKTHAVKCVRQICYLAKKIERPCSVERQALALQSYIQCEQEVLTREAYLSIPQESRHAFETVCDYLVTTMVSNDFTWDLHPKHGPGVTADRLAGNQKYGQLLWTNRMEATGLHAYEFLYPPSWWIYGEPERLNFLEPKDELPVKVVFVPKTLKTPRVIAVEPTHMQFVQQALLGYLSKAIGRHRITKGRINFTDQSVNRRMALSGSLDGSIATIDLSEASDRVSLSLVQTMFRSAPDFLDALIACRSTRAKLPTGQVLTLKKFASMGSATTFPVEALAFFAIALAGKILSQGNHVSPRLIWESSRQLFVFGDDIAIDAKSAPAVIKNLELFGLKVNTRKSFLGKDFKESCGGDYFRGEWVTPIYLRQDLPSNRTDAVRVVSVCATANQLYEAGYYSTATYLRKQVEKCVGKLPTLAGSLWNRETRQLETPVVGFLGFSDTQIPTRFNRELQRTEYRVLCPSNPKTADQIDGYAALSKSLRVAGQPDIPSDHLSVSVRPYGLALKRKWVPAHLVAG